MQPNAKLLVGTADCRSIEIWAEGKRVYEGPSPASFHWPDTTDLIDIFLLDYFNKFNRETITVENCIWLSRGDDVYILRFKVRENNQYRITFTTLSDQPAGE